MYKVEVSKLIEGMGLKNLTPDIPADEIFITQSDVNRPALQLTGYFDFFDCERIQIVGRVESTYISKMEKSKISRILEEFFACKIPCVIYSRDIQPCDLIFEKARKYGVPVLQTNKVTSSFMSDVIRWLNNELAPRVSIHGVLVDVYGEGVLIMGESGIGKSEAALELIKRGHRLVADDVVEIKRLSDTYLVGTSPEIIRYFIEIRGVGIVDVKTLFGVESVKEKQRIDLVIKVEDWDKSKEYDRLGLSEEHIDILGNKVISHTIPVRPGRNLAIIVESAAINHRQKQMGYNAAKELNDRLMGNIKKRSEERDKIKDSSGK